MSSYLVPIPAAKKRSGKLQFEESTGDRILENAFMNRMRGKVGVWRTGGVGNPGRGQQRPLPITLTPTNPFGNSTVTLNVRGPFLHSQTGRSQAT